MPPLLVHVILHVGLCSAAARVAPDTAVAIRMRLLDRHGDPALERSFRVDRGDDDSPKVVEFDAPQGQFLLQLNAPKYNCNATDYVALLPDHNRVIAENMSDGPPPPSQPLLLEGTAPQSFLYVQPTFVLLDKNATACNKPVGTPIVPHVVVENDQDAFYAWLYSDPSQFSGPPLQLALRLKTPTHQYHYVRVPIPFPTPWGGWPSNIRFDVSEDMVDELASQPVDTLLCLHLWETKVYY